MIEYLYIDEKRLDSYLSQFASEFADEKVPNWSFEASLTGPKIVGKQDRQTRLRSSHEKMVLLMKHLTSRKYISSTRPSQTGFPGEEEPIFRFEVCDAQRIVIPSRKEASDFAGMSLWISQANSTNGPLVLMEDFPKADRPGVFSTCMSHFSGLCFMLIQLKDELIKTPILDESVRDFLLEKEQENGYYFTWIDSPDFFLTALEGKITFNELELAEPISVFKRLGCYVGDTRRVQVLYRTRFFSDAKRGVFAYPIAVALDGMQSLLAEK